MQQGRSQHRAPGSFSPLTSSNSSSQLPPTPRPPPIKTTDPRASFESDEATTPTAAALNRSRSRNPGAGTSSPGPGGLSPGLSPGAAGPSSRTTSPSVYQSSIFASSSSSLSNPRAHPTSPATAAAIAARAGGHLVGGPGQQEGARGPSSPLAASPSIASTTTSSSSKGHHRKHSQTQGHFEPILPSTNTSNLHQHQQQQSSQLGPPHQQHRPNSPNSTANPNPTALAAAAQAAMQHQSQHLRQRSQTVPTPGETNNNNNLSPPYEPAQKPRGVSQSGGKGPLSPPILSLTEASAPRESGFGNQAYHNGLMGNHTAAATTAANVVFQRPQIPDRGQSSPGLPSQISAPVQLIPNRSEQQQQREPPPPPREFVTKAKPEKSSRKLFGRPSKISVKGDIKEKPQPSPSKIGAAFSSLQRGNFSTTSLVDTSSASNTASSASSLYNLTNSSSATIRAVDSPIDPGYGGAGSGGGKEGGKDAKEKKHHFLSRGKHKLSNKDSDYHSILSSSSSNSKPTDPSAPSIYNFNVPSSPGPATTSFKSGLDLRHGGRREKKSHKEDKLMSSSESRIGVDLYSDAASTHGGVGGGASEWPGPGSIGSLPGQSSMYLPEPLDPTRFGLNNMAHDDAWPYLKAKLLVIFQGEDLRLPVEDFNRVVTMHIQYCVQRRAPHMMLEDLKDLLATGFSSLDQALRTTPEDRLIPDLVELWLFTFTGVVPYMQAVFLPLDLEFSGNGTILSPEQARDFWGGVTTSMSGGSVSSPTSTTERHPVGGHGHGHHTSTASMVTPLSNVLDVRRLVLAAYRDAVILPRYDTLRQIFSRLSLEFLPMALQSPPPIPIAGNNSAGSGSFTDTTRDGNPLSTSPAASEPGNMFMGMHGAHAGSFSSMVGPPPLPRPGTAMSLDPSLASYNSTGTTLLGEGAGGGSSSLSNLPGGMTSTFGSGTSTGTNPGATTTAGISQILAGAGSRSRAISNVSFGSNFSAGNGSDRPFTPGGSSTINNLAAAQPRDNVEDSKQVTEMVGRMLQCMSVLAGVGVGDGEYGEEGNVKIGELCRLLKLNWLGRGRTGRNRRGIVGGRVRRPGPLPLTGAAGGGSGVFGGFTGGGGVEVR